MMKTYVLRFFNQLKNMQSFAKNSYEINNLPRLQRINSYSGLFNKNNLFSFSQKKSNDQMESLKSQSKQFYSNYVEDIIQLQKSKDWPLVIGNTKEPMIIDFYADWCGPCKKLTPILEQRVKKTQGRVKLLKVNIDKCGQLANQLKITSVPTVYAVFRGQGLDSFQGLPQNSRIDKLFETLDKVVSIADKSDKAYQYLTVGKQHLAQGNYQQAQKSFLQLSDKGVDEQLLALKDVLLAQCFLSQHKIAKFKDQVQKMKKFQEYYLLNPQLKDFYQLMISQGLKLTEQSNKNPEVEELKNKIKTFPNDLDSRFRLSQVYKEQEMMEESLEQLLDILKFDKNWEDKKANKQMLVVFKQLGNTSPITQKYRKLMQRILY